MAERKRASPAEPAPAQAPSVPNPVHVVRLRVCVGVVTGCPHLLFSRCFSLFNYVILDCYFRLHAISTLICAETATWSCKREKIWRKWSVETRCPAGAQRRCFVRAQRGIFFAGKSANSAAA